MSTLKNSWHLIVAMLLLFVALVAVCFSQDTVAPQSHCQKMYTPFAYTLCDFVPNSRDSLSLVWQDTASNVATPSPLLSFDNLKKMVSQNGKQLVFAMNAGMYDDQFAPIGYTVIKSKLIHSLNLKEGAGNFHLMPNGVFWWDQQGYHITESHALAKLLDKGKKPLYATQSGPMLVINGNIHPGFDPDSSSQKIRNGVGICQDGHVKFVISDTWVTFYQFADLYKRELQCDNALFLDGGRASALYSQQLNRHDSKYMGAMLAVTR